MEDPRLMLRCFDLARRSLGANKTNPMVGSVIVYQNSIIGEGYHTSFGGPHAEINALQSVKTENRKYIPVAVLYVSLEPCSHYGKTPPCTHAIIESGIKKVIIGTPDPNPLVSGSGIKKLQDAGIQVFISQHEGLARQLIRPFGAHLQQRPYITLKCVKSKDHFIGRENESIWLSNTQSKVYAHDVRSRMDAILVGKKTVQTDNPSLTVREVKGKNPVRVLIDPNLECIPSSRIFEGTEEVIVYNMKENNTQGNVTRVKLNPEKSIVQQIAKHLFSKSILSLLVEGGAATLMHFLREGLWDEAIVIDTPSELKQGIPAPDIVGLLHKKTELGDNVVRIIHSPET
jgi:diaminohydroxyphosphoribosylaminopyrimidine deaminase/5-amino-6-(5-phosphoribosylamino)uracil reductase